LLNALYAEKYNAKIIFVIDDTIGSEEKQVVLEAYKLLPEAFDWLNVKYEKPILCKSNRLEIYYEHAEKLIKKDKAYVCHCSAEVLRANREKGIDCGCRNNSLEENLKEWKQMFDKKSKTGDSILRLKTSMQDPNPAFRDRVLFRICERPHPKVGTKYKVWPTLEMTWAIDDYLLGITHIIRGNDLMIETAMEKYIWDIFGWKHPETIHAGLVRIECMDGAKLSKSKAQKEVKSGEFIGWDDPRTWSIQSLARRGIKKEAIRDFVKEIGLNKNDIEVNIEALYAINRKMIDADSLRYFFIENPFELEIKKAPEIKKVEVPVHPDKQEKRDIAVNKIFISKKDYDENKNKEIRLLHLYNVKLGKEAEFTSLENKDVPRIQWVSDNVKARILMVNGSWIEGIAEKNIEHLKVNDIIQFERVGFVRFDGKKNDKYEFWFAHR
jgi:glutamyl-tRNA synthetase